MSCTVGETVKGEVIGVADYGAFVRLEDGSSGMIHISKLSKGFVADIREFIKKGDPVTATVISCENGKIALSLIGEERSRRNKKEPTDFESMLSAFKTVSEEKIAGMNSRNKRKKR